MNVVGQRKIHVVALDFRRYGVGVNRAFAVEYDGNFKKIRTLVK